jgi:thiamine transporter ThiT
MNWTVVPRITGGLGCMIVLILGIASGVEPLLCTLRGLIGGMVGWIAGALWAAVMSQLMPSEPTAEPEPTVQPETPRDETAEEAEAA